MEPISEHVVCSGARTDARRRRVWGVFTLAVSAGAAMVAFVNGTFLGSATSGLSIDALQSSWTSELAAELRGAVRVPGDYATIQQAIAGSSDGATIVIAPGVYHERISLRNRTLHLWGVGGAKATRLVGDGTAGPIADIQGGSIQFDGIAFQGGIGEAGRGASVLDGAARFTDCQFHGNCGGAKAVDAQVRFEACSFLDNRAEISGGALQSERSDIRLDGCTLQDNAAGTCGGGVSASRGTLDLFETTLSGNRLNGGAWGGGLYAEGTEVIVRRGSFRGNTSGESGAAAYLFGGHGSLQQVDFMDNISPAAWSVHGQNASVQVTGGRLQGSAMSNFAGDVVSDHVVFEEAAGEDCDSDGLPDRWSIDRGWTRDCDGNGRPDSCDADGNANGIVDACERSLALADTDASLEIEFPPVDPNVPTP